MIELIRHKPPFAPTVSKLESLLELAKSGEIQSIAVATLDPRGYTSSAYAMAPGHSDFAMVGSIDYLKDRIMKRIRDRHE